MSATGQGSGVAEAPVSSVARSSFYLAMRILASKQRQAMYQVYAFCRAVDDIADDGGPRSERLERLDRWRADIGHLFAGNSQTELAKGLVATVQSFDLRQEDFLSVIDGMEMDVVRDSHAPGWETLDLYCDRVASAVGRLSVRIFGIEDEKGRLLSHHLGRALQMTNILRDIDEDAGLGRLYLPKEALAEAGIDDRDISKVLANPALGVACATVAVRAQKHFDEADAVMARCSRDSVRSPRVMASVYRALLDRLVARGWTAPRLEVPPSKLQFLWAVMRHGIV
jgi:presqualene diphosphate synthase